MIDNSELETSKNFLIWEDADKEAWWLARSHDQDSVYIIAPDSVTAHILVLRQPAGRKSFHVVVAIPISQSEGQFAAVAEAKRATVRLISDTRSPVIQSGVRKWRVQRWSQVALREVPLALVALVIGVVLAFFVAAFFIMTDFTGWTMVAVGTLLGLSSGWLLKWAADRKFTSLMGPLGRFFTVTGSATIGALLTVSASFVLFGG